MKFFPNGAFFLKMTKKIWQNRKKRHHLTYFFEKNGQFLQIFGQNLCKRRKT